MTTNCPTDGKHAIVLVMSVASPWSVDIASKMHRLGAKVLVCSSTPRADVEKSVQAADGLQRLNELGIATSLAENRSGLRGVPDLIRRLRATGTDQPRHVLCLYGGLQGLATWASNVRPFSVFWVGSDILLQAPTRTLLISAISKSAKYNFANGRYLAKAALDRYGPHRFEGFYHGIDTNHWQCAPRQPMRRIICVRWFEPIYDNKVILQAANALAKHVSNFELVFAAGGSQLEQAKAEVQPIAKDRINFLNGVTREQLHRELSAASIYVSMSKSDGTSTAMLEALSMGLFPILSDIPANREWISNDGCDGILVPVGDVVALTSALRAALDDPERLMRAQQRNRATVVRLADASTNIAKLLTLMGAR